MDTATTNSVNRVTSRGLIISAPASGCGKTTLTLALLRLLTSQNLNVASFKVGPDYIDPAFHAAATGGTSHNVDPWGMRSETCATALTAAARGADLVIGEGMMGLFDGADGEEGSTAELAAILGLPVVLIVDAGAQAASAGALIRGFRDYRANVKVAGVIFNRVGGEAHAKTLREACMPLNVPVLGMMPWDERLTLPERHLGLIQAGEIDELGSFLEVASDIVEQHVNVEALLRSASAIDTAASNCGSSVSPLGQRIAVAQDAAFAFVYEHVVDGWRGAGSEILPFSPLAEEGVPKGADSIYLPGGYPELHAGTISGNPTFLNGLREAAERRLPVYGECGGYMVLGEALIDADGLCHSMAGLLPVVTSFAAPVMHIGYRALTVATDSVLGLSGTVFRGHEFHVCRTVTEDKSAPLFAARDIRGEEETFLGCVRGSVMGSFAHLIDRA